MSTFSTLNLQLCEWIVALRLTWILKFSSSLRSLKWIFPTSVSSTDRLHCLMIKEKSYQNLDILALFDNLMQSTKSNLVAIDTKTKLRQIVCSSNRVIFEVFPQFWSSFVAIRVHGCWSKLQYLLHENKAYFTYGIPLDWAPLSLQLTYLHVMILISVLSHNLQLQSRKIKDDPNSCWRKIRFLTAISVANAVIRMAIIFR